MLDKINTHQFLRHANTSIKDGLMLFVGEPNDDICRTAIANMACEVLHSLQMKRLIEGFTVVCDQTNNTPSMIDNDQLGLDIFLRVDKSVESIKLSFTLGAENTVTDHVENYKNAMKVLGKF